MKIGQKVKVIERGYHYPIYEEQFKIMGFKDTYPKQLKGGFASEVYTIFAKNRSASNYKIYGIEDSNGNQYLFQKEGLEKVNSLDVIMDEIEASIKNTAYEYIAIWEEKKAHALEALRLVSMTPKTTLKCDEMSVELRDNLKALILECNNAISKLYQSIAKYDNSQCK